MDELKFIQSVKEYRKITGISQETMSRKIGVSLRSYQRLEAGELSLSLTQYLKILETVNPRLEKSLELIMNSDHFNNFALRDQHVLKLAPRKIHNNVEKDWLDYNKKCPMLNCNKVGYLEWNLTRLEYYWSEEMYDIYELKKNVKFSHDLLMGQISPADYLSCKINMDKMINENAPFHFVHSRKHSKRGLLNLVTLARMCEYQNDTYVYGVTLELKVKNSLENIIK
ncbi:MAG: hypothetical protein CME62_03505 [Halobacteriovoraceae bacterium]|nr:hypothetical protein [Halobacteriovoraceae bacterium]|tara:strand:- start:37591 stop:38268 length:678 start_codon:yes stop_codon:yes gene_type:complete